MRDASWIIPVDRSLGPVPMVLIADGQIPFGIFPPEHRQLKKMLAESEGKLPGRLPALGPVSSWFPTCQMEFDQTFSDTFSYIDISILDLSHPLNFLRGA